MSVEPLSFLVVKIVINKPENIPFITSLGSIDLNDYLHKNLYNDDQIKYLSAIKRWHEGRLTEYIEFKNNKLHGRYEINYKNGKKHIRCFYMNGEKHGVFKLWYENGNISLLQEFKNGKQHGKYEAYYEGGFISETTNYIDGKRSGKNIVYGSNGNIKEIKYNLNGLLHGKYTKWTGNLRKERCYKNGILHGEYKIYQNEQLIRHKLYVEGTEIINYLIEIS
ncbi:MORN repeat protein [Pacmanvirus A23]|uniref:MORN repeat protein n=1 Tax=Pacmanvirus A23 TaxID=1932881 RepID=UPI000A095B92|nr:MORN repeat protein [Pacmanvirus A23]SIP85888.1 MORN repeat protein [Pacmanvirus A23]